MINATHVANKRKNYHMTERTHGPRPQSLGPRLPCFCDDDDHNDATDIQITHGRPPFMLPATLTVTRIFSHSTTRSQKAVPVRASGR